MKLKCDQHNRRVLTIPGSNTFLHRTGDLSKCTSKTANMGGKPVEFLGDGILIRPDYRE